MKWFKHDSDAAQDAKIRKLIIKHGPTGYAVYFYCLELISGNVSDANITFELEHDAEIIADGLKVPGTPERAGVDVVNDIMRYMVSLGLFEASGDRITCLKMANRLDQSMTSNSRMRSLIAKARENHVRVMISHDSVKKSHARLDETRLDEKREEGDEATASVSSNTEIDAIIDYLNTKAGRHYRHTEPNRKGIRARIAEGYTSADCRRVIDTKVSEWQGTDMEKHLNCETLFRPSKFDKYLNQAKPTTDDKYERLDNGVMVYRGLI